MRINSLKTKLIASFTVISLGAAVVGLMGSSSIERIDELLHQTTDEQVPTVLVLGQARNEFNQALYASHKGEASLLMKDQKQLQSATKASEEALRSYSEAIDALNALPKQDSEARDIAKLEDAYRRWKVINDDIWQAIHAGDPQRAWEGLDRRSPTTREVLGLLNSLFDHESKTVESTNQESVAVVAAAQRNISLTAVLTVLLAFGAGVFMTLRITQPIEKMKHAAKQIALGDTQQKIEHAGGDEIGELAQSFREVLDYLDQVAKAADDLSRGDVSSNIAPRSDRDRLSLNVQRALTALRGLIGDSKSMIEAARSGELTKRADASTYEGAYAEIVVGLNQVLESVAEPLAEANRTLERVANRDLTARVNSQFKGEYGRMMTSLNQATKNLEESMLHVATASEQVASASSQIAASSQSVAQGASEQASALEETSSALIEMSARTKQTADNANSANELSERARNASNNGGAVTAEMMQAMSRIRDAAEGTAAIIRDINEIAFQTNLLALNAAVEAARAGDAGRGFAVVAEEVRNLALRSKEAAKKTEALIGESMSLSEQGEVLSGRVNTTLSEIVDAVGKVSGIVASIADSSQEQAEGIEQSNKAMAQMDQVTQQSAANSEETSSAAEELSAQAQELAALVGRFQLSRATSKGKPRATSHAAVAPVRAPLARPAFAPRAAANGNGKNNGKSNGNGYHLSAESLIPFDDEVDLASL